MTSQAESHTIMNTLIFLKQYELIISDTLNLSKISVVGIIKIPCNCNICPLPVTSKPDIHVGC